MMNPGQPMGGGGNEWLIQLLNALFGGQRPGGAPMGGQGMPGGMQTGMPGGMSQPQAGGFPQEPRMPMPGTMDRTQPPSQGPVTPGQSPFHPPQMPKMGGY